MERVMKAIATIKNMAENKDRQVNKLILADMIKVLEDSVYSSCETEVFEAIGWAYADCCSSLNNCKDPRQTNMGDVIKRARIDLCKGNQCGKKLPGIERA